MPFRLVYETLLRTRFFPAQCSGSVCDPSIKIGLGCIRPSDLEIHTDPYPHSVQRHLTCKQVLSNMSKGVRLISIATFHNEAIWKQKEKWHVKSDKNKFVHQLELQPQIFYSSRMKPAISFHSNFPVKSPGLFQLLNNSADFVIRCSYPNNNLLLVVIGMKPLYMA